MDFLGIAQPLLQPDTQGNLSFGCSFAGQNDAFLFSFCLTPSQFAPLLSCKPRAPFPGPFICTVALQKTYAVFPGFQLLLKVYFRQELLSCSSKDHREAGATCWLYECNCCGPWAVQVLLRHRTGPSLPSGT